MNTQQLDDLATNATAKINVLSTLEFLEKLKIIRAALAKAFELGIKTATYRKYLNED
tara:strand:- start:1041 stop:1211 length:171 start_codon:yes stop_codon:yes gene_type:complete